MGGDKASFFPELTFSLILSCDLCLDLLFRSFSDGFGLTAGGGDVTAGFGKAFEVVVAVKTLLMSLDFDGDCVRSLLGLVRGDNGSGVLFDIRICGTRIAISWKN